MWTHAQRHSLATLLNSLFLEWNHFSLKWPFIVLRHENLELEIELSCFSKVGHHQYTGKVLLNSRPIEFADFLTTLSEILKLDTKFVERVLQSESCVADALKINIEHLTNITPNFKHTETALYIGHSLHPAPKSRTEFSKTDLFNYSPEHGGRFKVTWFLVDQSIYFQEHSESFHDLHWSEKISNFKAKDQFQLLPVHPWQKKQMLKLPIIQNYLQEGLIIDLGEDSQEWTPTSSLRTIYQEKSPYMLKFSLDLKMTNSIRHLLIHELKRGIQIFDVSHHPRLKSFFQEFNHFKIIQEPLYAGILDSNNDPIIQTLVMVRDNPFLEDQEVSLLATLTQPAVEKEEVFLKRMIDKSELSAQAWFKLFLDKAIAPFLVLQAEYGILLGAHQQNLILKLTDGKPSGVYFRDCHGTGYEADKVALYQNEIKTISEDNDNILHSPLSHYLFAYYVVINSLFNTMAALARCAHVDEKELIGITQNFLKNLKKRSNFDSSFVDYLLYSPELKHKGNFFCTVRNINENTSTNPLDIYTDIANPLKEHVHE